MHFLFPEAFLLLFAFLPLVRVLRRGEERTRAVAGLYRGDPPRKWYFLARAVFISALLGSLVVIGARPYTESGVTGDYVFLVDVSRSMHARHTCGDLTFLDRAKNIMREVLAAVPEARFGIIAFDRFTFPISQMTYDHSYLNEVINEGLHVGLTFEATRTELANALSVTARKKARLPESYGGVEHVILLSDGHLTGAYERRMAGPLQELRDAGMRVLAIGVGNPGQTPIMHEEQGRCVNEHIQMDNEVVQVPLRDDILKLIAGETQGQYFAEGETERLVALLRGEMEAPESGGGGYRRDISGIFLLTATLSLFGLLLAGVIARFKL